MRRHLCSYFVLFTEIKYLRLSGVLLGNQNVSRIKKRTPELILKRDFFVWLIIQIEVKKRVLAYN